MVITRFNDYVQQQRQQNQLFCVIKQTCGVMMNGLMAFMNDDDDDNDQKVAIVVVVVVAALS